MGSPSAVLNGLRIARPEPLPRGDYLLRQRVLKLPAVKNTGIRILTGAFSAVIPLTALRYENPSRRLQLWQIAQGRIPSDQCSACVIRVPPVNVCTATCITAARKK